MASLFGRSLIVVLVIAIGIGAVMPLPVEPLFAESLLVESEGDSPPAGATALSSTPTESSPLGSTPTLQPTQTQALTSTPTAASSATAAATTTLTLTPTATAAPSTTAASTSTVTATGYRSSHRDRYRNGYIWCDLDAGGHCHGDVLPVADLDRLRALFRWRYPSWRYCADHLLHRQPCGEGRLHRGDPFTVGGGGSLTSPPAPPTPPLCPTATSFSAVVVRAGQWR